MIAESVLALTLGQVAFAGNYTDPRVVEGITYRTRPDVVLYPLRETFEAIGATVEYDNATAMIEVERLPIQKEWLEEIDDVNFIELQKIKDVVKELGATTEMIPQATTVVNYGVTTAHLTVPVHRVEISINEQRIRGFQGKRLVFQSNCSTGRSGFATPHGTYSAGPEIVRMRYSRKYDNAPMPWSVQVNGGVFIHGSSSVPRYPASHGCIRMPLTGTNPAKTFWNWVEPGAVIVIAPEFITPVAS